MAVRGVVPGEFVRKRIQRVFLLILACYLSLIARLVYLQGAQGPTLRDQAQQMREQEIRLRAHRGSIYDRDEKPLAMSLYSGTVGFDPAAVLPDAQSPEKTRQTEARLQASVQHASGILGIPAAQLAEMVRAARARYSAVTKIRFVPLKKDVPLETAQQIRDTRPRLLGFGVEDGSKRVYSSADNAAQVIGFLGPGPGEKGAAGLERSFNDRMNGYDGKAIAEVDDRRREIPGTVQKLIPAKDGLDVHTTLDANAQHIATQEAERILEKYHPNGISVVIVEPETGDILSLVSLPTFDPNPGQRQKLNGESLADRCAARLYEPGSTLKAITVASALDQGIITENSTFYCAGRMQIGKKFIKCDLHDASERGGHGVVTPLDILRRSCNIGSARVGLKMGPERLFAAERAFGLLDPLNIGLPAEMRGRLSFDRNENIYSAAKVARVAFGHSITTTPLHVAMAYAAIVNGGKLMRPRLVKSVTDGSGKVKQTWEPKVVRRVLKPETAEAVQKMMRAVVTNGTGKVAAIPGYQVGGKTGTASKYRRGAYVGSFIGFLPASPKVTPRVVILVAVDEPHGAYYGADVAAPVFQAIARRLMEYWRVPEDDPEATQAIVAAENWRKQHNLPAKTLRRADLENAETPPSQPASLKTATRL